MQGKIGREDHMYWIAQTGRQGGMFSQSRIPCPLKEEMSIEDMGGKSYKKQYVYIKTNQNTSKNAYKRINNAYKHIKTYKNACIMYKNT